MPPAWTMPAPLELGALVVAAAADEDDVLDAADDEAELPLELAELTREAADAEADDAAEDAELTTELTLALTLERRLETDALTELATAEADPVVVAPEIVTSEEKFTNEPVLAAATPKLYVPLDEDWMDVGIWNVAVPLVPSMLAVY